MRKKIGLAILGCGSRAAVVVGNLRRLFPDETEIVAVYNPSQAPMTARCQEWNAPNAKRCASSLEAIRTPGVDWVMIFSPNAFHKAQILESFAAQKDIFCEKPMATNLKDCETINRAWRVSGRQLVTGFVLRYSPLYRKAKELLDAGKLGRILAVEANNHIAPKQGGDIFCNWRRHTAISGPYVLEMGCHDLDQMLWLLNTKPSKVFALGGREFFRSENRFLEEKYGKACFRRKQPKDGETPFTDDTDLMDTFTGSILFRNNVRGSFTVTMDSVIPERRMVFRGTEGTLDLELYSGMLRWQLLNETKPTVFDSRNAVAAGDDQMMRELMDAMQGTAAPQCGGEEGLTSAVFALALDKSARTGKVIDLETMWDKLES